MTCGIAHKPEGLLPFIGQVHVQTHLTVRMPEKACEATEDIRPRASELLRSTALVCCLYSDAVHAVPTTTPACSAGARWYLSMRRCSWRVHPALILDTSSKKQLVVAWIVTISWLPARMGPSRQDKQNSTTKAPDASSTARGPRSLDTLLHVQAGPSSLCSKRHVKLLCDAQRHLALASVPFTLTQGAHLNTRLRRLSNSLDINAVSSAGSWRSKKSMRCSNSVRNSSRRNVASTCASRAGCLGGDSPSSD
jgi:hypothetical protein